LLAWQQQKENKRITYIIILKTKKPFSRKTYKNETTAPVRAAFLNQWLVKLLVFKMCVIHVVFIYEGWNFNSGNYLFTTDTK